MSSKLLLSAALVAVALPAAAREDDCAAVADRQAEVDAAGAERIEIVAAAGDLDVSGVSGTRVATTGRACARDEDDLERVQLRAVREGAVVRVVADIPRDIDDAWLDLRIALPQGIPVRIMDSSGDVQVRHVGALDLRDSSGDVEIEDVPGSVRVEDSSGDVDVKDAPGSITLEDSSGELYLERVGDVHVVSDSSGDIRIVQASAVRIDVDSSGEIVCRDVTGDVSIGDDSSGSIVVNGVGGDFTVESDGSGVIDDRNVAGRVSIPGRK
jgi:hypothetical protein